LIGRVRARRHARFPARDQHGEPLKKIGPRPCQRDAQRVENRLQERTEGPQIASMHTALARTNRLKRRRLRWRRGPSARRDYNYFRDYEPATGRYIESDPVGLKGGLSTYAYVASMPLIAMDPMGDQYMTTTWAERWNCVRRYGYQSCSQASECADKAFAFQRSIAPNDFDSGGRGDAKRHCYLSCCLSRNLGPDTASGILDDHEFYNPPPPGRRCERFQDQWNNEALLNFEWVTAHAG
jgi:RHS repeat-associated protein